MAQDIDLKEIEKKAWTSNFQDGLMDILLGIYLLGGGMQAFILYFFLPYPLDHLLVSVTFYIIGIFIYILCKKYVVIPRIGVVKFGKSRKRRIRHLAYINLIWVILTLILVLLTNLRIFQILMLKYLKK